jgi:transglutaminase-like putative cysteine protease
MRRSNDAAQKLGKLKPFVALRKASLPGQELFILFPSGKFVLITLSMMLGILLIAVPLFLLLPRVSLGIYHRPSAHSQLMSGFSETVQLGEIGSILLSDAMVMTVRLNADPDRLPTNLKWRGVALDFYDGTSWSRSRAARSRLTPQGEYFRLEETAQGTNILTQTFLLEAMSTNILFAGHKALAISGDVGFLVRDTSDNLYTARNAFNKIRYTAVSDITRPDPAMIPQRAGPIPGEIRDTFLQLPEVDDRILQLTQSIVAPLDNQFAKARAIEEHLRGNYGYSLNLRGNPGRGDPLAAFLFDVREGHCEYFASAMTVMLRQAGIPARLVNGFTAGTYNSLARAWSVRQRNAHSWVEAYFEPYGWVEFDPTPAAPPVQRSPMTQWISNLLDAVNIWWAEDIVNYDFWKQYRLIAAVRTAARDAALRVRAILRDISAAAQSQWEQAAPHRWMMIPGLVLLSLPLVLGFMLKRGRMPRLGRLLRRLRRPFRPMDRSHAIIGFYAEALSLLKRHGFSRMRGDTPMEFADSLKHHPAGQPLSALTQIYHQMRFGGTGGSRELSEARVLIESIKKAL